MSPKSTTPQAMSRARTLRKTQTPFEQQLWYHLRDSRFTEFKFRRQYPIGKYIVDFVCLQRRLIVELDGSQHSENVSHDQERDGWLKLQGFTVLRFWNNQWGNERDGVLQAILNAL
jgi:very-short-patch-repair endonuclease